MILIQVLLESHSNIYDELEKIYVPRDNLYNGGTTPLYFAVEFDVFDIYKILLEYHPRFCLYIHY